MCVKSTTPFELKVLNYLSLIVVVKKMAIELDPYNMVVAVNNLNDTLKETNYFKDYILPIAGLILSGLFGYVIAIRGYKWQECVQNERMKVDTINKAILMFQDMQNNLTTIKSTYFDRLTHHPLQRVGNIQQMIYDETIMVLEAERLVQIGLADKKITLLKRLVGKKELSHETPWLNTPHIISVVSNYNYILKIIKMRNEIDQLVKDELSKKYGAEYSEEMSEQLVIKGLGRSLFVRYIDVTEFMILQIDNMILNINDFLLHYPNAISKRVNNKYLSNYKVVTGYKNNTAKYRLLVGRTQALDIGIMASYVGMSTEEAYQKYGDFSIIETK